MKIAFLNLYSGINNRGAEAFTHELANRLLENHETTFFQAGDEAADQKMRVIKIKNRLNQPSSQFSNQFLPHLLKRFFLDEANRAVASFTWKLLPRLRKGDFALVVPLNGFWQLLLLKLFQPLGKYKLLVIGHSGPGWDERFNLYLHPDVFIATTRPAYDWATRTSSWTRVELIPYALDAQQFESAKPKIIPLPKPIILCPAALVPYKRIELAIAAVAGLKNGSLLVLGQGPLEGKLLWLGKRKLGNRFGLTSAPHEQMSGYYAAADLVTLPSAPQENSPMVFPESLAAGKLVVTTDTQRHRWMLENAGIFTDPTNTHHYTQALQQALERKGDRETNEDIRAAFTKFSWTHAQNAYERVLKSL